MLKQFKEILLKICDEPMRDQEVYLADFLNKWAGSYEQVDDILVIGFRL